jgi:hypothetical protein
VGLRGRQAVDAAGWHCGELADVPGEPARVLLAGRAAAQKTGSTPRSVVRGPTMLQYRTSEKSNQFLALVPEAGGGLALFERRDDDTDMYQGVIAKESKRYLFSDDGGLGSRSTAGHPQTGTASTCRRLNLYLTA